MCTYLKMCIYFRRVCVSLKNHLKTFFKGITTLSYFFKALYSYSVNLGVNYRKIITNALLIDYEIVLQMILFVTIKKFYFRALKGNVFSDVFILHCILYRRNFVSGILVIFFPCIYFCHRSFKYN